jgi:hypothetical protein
MEHIPMRKGSVFALLTAGAALSMALATAPAALASGGPGGGGGSGSGRPGGPPVAASGTGTLGSQWTLKSMHDDDAAGNQIVGEEFEINTPAGQTWTVTFFDDGVPFQNFHDQSVLSTAAGIRANSSTANVAGTQQMTVHAANAVTGEVIDASVDLPALSTTRN